MRLIAIFDLVFLFVSMTGMKLKKAKAINQDSNLILDRVIQKAINWEHFL